MIISIIQKEPVDGKADEDAHEDSRNPNGPPIIRLAHPNTREPVGLQMLEVEDGLVLLFHLSCQKRQPVRGLLLRVAHRSPPMPKHSLGVVCKDLLPCWSDPSS